MYLVIWFRSIPLWICVGGKGKNEKLIRPESTNAWDLQSIWYIRYLVYLLLQPASHLTCALQWQVSPYFLHLDWLWHPDICQGEHTHMNQHSNLCQRKKSADRSRNGKSFMAISILMTCRERRWPACWSLIVFSGPRPGLHTNSVVESLTLWHQPTFIHSFQAEVEHKSRLTWSICLF